MDFDGDGQGDVLSGSGPGALYLFRGKPDGSFAGGEPIKDRADKPLVSEAYSTAFAADWDADEDLDLLIGSHSGKVYHTWHPALWPRVAFLTQVTKGKIRAPAA